MPNHRLLTPTQTPSQRQHFNRVVRPVRRCAHVAVLIATGVLVCTTALAGPAITTRDWAGKFRLPTGPASQPVAPGSSTIRMPGVVAGGFGDYTVSGDTAVITQNSATGILRWQYFDIAPGATVNINQPSSSAVLLNKVDGGQFDNKTAIDGFLNANGQVYIYNPNGIIIGKTARINVGSLFATTLKIDDSRFLAGLMAPNSQAIFARDTALPDRPGAVVVEGQAAISSGPGGKIFLIAPEVSNSGALYAPDGQVALIAGDKVYLGSSSSSNLRGLVIEVDNKQTLGPALESTATNTALGNIQVGRGNATLVALAVNQQGTISATTSITLNGSIYLKARDGAGRSGTDMSAAGLTPPDRGGVLTLGPNSVTQVLPSLDDKSTAADAPAFNPSEVQLQGKTIHLQPNAQVLATGGQVSVVAKANPGSPADSLNDSRVYFESGSRIDVSGSSGTRLPMENNVIELELRGTEFADNPILRNSPLRGQKVRVDIRKGIKIANIDGWLSQVQHNVGENTAYGGTVTITSEGDIIQRAGSTIDVSGGWVDYLSGYVNTTKVRAGGAVFDISAASATRTYNGLFNLPNGPRNFEPGYREGKSAGTVQFSAPRLVLQGDLRGDVTVGPRQRQILANDFRLRHDGNDDGRLGKLGINKAMAESLYRPSGGELIIGNIAPDNTGRIDSSLDSSLSYGYSGKVNFGGGATRTAVAPGADEAFDPANADHALLASRLDLNTANLSAAGFSWVRVATGGDVEVDTPSSLMEGGKLQLWAFGAIEFKAGVSIASGSLTASAKQNLKVNDGVAFDLAGRWVNDRPAGTPARDLAGNPTTPLALKGGALDLSSNLVEIGNGVSADVSGGAWLDAKRKLTSGDAGSITMAAAPLGLVRDSTLRLGTALAFSGYGLNKGGTLNLTGRNVVIGGTADDGDLSVVPGLFQLGGFTAFKIAANGNFDVLSGALIEPRASSWRLGRAYESVESGGMRNAASIALLDLAGPLGPRPATNISLGANETTQDGAGRLTFGAGAILRTDPGAKVTLSAGQQVLVDGTIDAPAGTINIALNATTGAPFKPERSIWFGSHAQLTARGSTARIYTNQKEISSGEVLNGGRIRVGTVPDQNDNVAAAVGYVIAEEGAQFDVSGVQSALLRFNSGRGASPAQQIASDGGEIDILAREGLLWAGSLTGSAGGSGARGGSLFVAVDRGQVGEATGYPNDGIERNLILASAAPPGGIIPAGLKPGEAVVGSEGQGWLHTAVFAGGGFDRLRFKSQDVISFDLTGGNLPLTARSSVVFDSPALRAAHASTGADSVTIASQYVQIGSEDNHFQTPPASSGGLAKLDISAGGTADVIGNSVLQGFGNANIYANEDIRLVGALPVAGATDPRAVGSLTVQGNLALTAAQIYPTTLSEFTLQADSKLSFNANGNVPVSPLSAGGSVIGKANVIEQNGNLKAPLGKIALTATDTLTYAPGSLTSVSADGLIPFGRVVNGRDWVYDFGNNNIITFKASPTGSDRSLIEKSIVSTAPKIQTQAGAVLDLSGGGDLYAYEFTPGPGGSRDVLAKADGEKMAGVFAINPNFRSGVAPRDWQYGTDGGLQAGDSIYLSGMKGLPAGTYTLLPAHYALLAGGYSVMLAPGTRDRRANTPNLDGSMTVAGYFTVAGTGTGDTRWSGFTVSSGSVVRTRSEFSDYYANAFFAKQAAQADAIVPRLPHDAGRIAFDATQSLVLDALVRLGAATDGRRGVADISAPDIVVVADRGQDTGSALKLVADNLVALGADSLLLGGLRELGSDGTHVTVGAQNVKVQNNAAHALSGPEVILAAKDTVRLDAGAVVVGQGIPTQTPQDLIIEGSGDAANGALIRVSGGVAVKVVRTAPTRTAGTLDVAAGAIVRGDGSVYLDATKTSRFDGALLLGSGASLGIGASRISLGSGIPGAVEGIKYDNAAIAGLSALNTLILTSYSTLDFYGGVSLGSASTKRLSLNAAGIQGYGGGGTGTERSISLLADTIAFGNSGAAAFSSPGAPADRAGTASVNARNVEIGAGRFDIKGYSDVSIAAQDQIVGTTGDGALRSAGPMTVATPRITAQAGARTTLSADGGDLVLNRLAMSTVLASAPLGGRLALEGDHVVSRTTLATPSGQTTITSLNGVALEDGSRIDAAGRGESFGTATAYSPGGNVLLDGGSGIVDIKAGAEVDVSATGNDAGSITIKTTNTSGTGTFNVAGTLKGGSTPVAGLPDPRRGEFRADTDRLAGFGAFNSLLNDAGFGGARDFRIRKQDVTLANGETIRSRGVSVAADNGDINIAGEIDASGASGGNISLYAGQPLASGSKGRIVLTSTSYLHADARAPATTSAGTQGDGGRVELATGSVDGLALASVSGGNSIDIQGGRIDVSGNGVKGQGGTVVLRAPRLGSGAGSDVAVTQLAGSITGSRETVVEAYKVYTATGLSEAATAGGNINVAASSGSFGPSGTLWTEGVSFYTQAGAILGVARLNKAGDASVHLRPGMEVRSAGDLTVSVNESLATSNARNRGWNLNAWRFGGATNETGVLTLRAAGNLIVNGAINDGFVKPSANFSMPAWDLDNKASWSYRLVAGADFASAPLAVKASATTGDFKLNFARRTATSGNDQGVALIRTGTGSIDIAAGRDILLDSIGSGANLNGATIYTAGMARSTPGFTAPTSASSGSGSSAFGGSNTAWGAVSGKGRDVTAAFGDLGGAISMHAVRNIQGAATKQFVNQWLYRQGRVDSATGNFVDGLNTAWWTRYDYFNQGIATLGGGNVVVMADTGQIKDLSLSAATNAYIPGSVPDASKLDERGGGDIYARAGTDILGGLDYVQAGRGDLVAGGSVGYINPTTSSRPVLALGNGSFNITAVRNAEIETVFNPTLARQSTDNAPLLGNLARIVDDDKQLSAFSTYEQDSAVRLSSLSGSVVLDNVTSTISSMLGNRLPPANWGTAEPLPANKQFLLVHYPGTVSATAFGGDIVINGGFSMAPSARGQLQLLANGNVNAGNVASTQRIAMLDAYPAQLAKGVALPALLATTYVTASDYDPFLKFASGSRFHPVDSLHLSDPSPTQVVARTGDVIGAANVENTLISPKQLEIEAGRDIVNFGFTAQHLADLDRSRVSAGRDIIDTTALGTDGISLGKIKHYVEGPGRIDFTAGRNFDLGNHVGVVTRGNLDNPYLAAKGADIGVLAGARPDYVNALRTWRSTFGLEGASDATLTAYADSHKAQLYSHFFELLRQTSGATGDQKLDLTAFDAVIATLFPTQNITGGNINVFGSMLKTERGGTIDMFAPGGSTYVGLVTEPAYLAKKDAAAKGIFTVKGGEIRALVHDDFLVNTGRVFTLGGGEITLVSQYGNIDAGKGAKTSVATPPPLLTTNPFTGDTVIDISGSISGAGIATLKSGEGVPSSNVYPIAPRGIFDAGDAGLRASGDVKIVAAVVLNAGNIAAAGSVSGSQVVDTGSLGAISAPSVSTAPKTDDVMKNLNPDSAAAPATLTVELLGYGGSDQKTVTQEAENPCPPDEQAGGDRRKKNCN